MNVGLVTDFYYPWVGGPSAAVRSLALGLNSRGHRVSLLAPSPAGTSYQEHEGGIVITRAPTVPVPFGYGVRASLPLPIVRRWLRRERPDVLHVHHPFPLSAAAILAARTQGIPVVATNHTIPECSLWGLRAQTYAYGFLDRALSRWIVWLLSRCDAVTTPTETAAEALREIGFRRPIHAISNGIDIQRFRPGPPAPALQARLGLDTRPAVLYTGRLDAEKEMDVWLRGIARAAERVDLQAVVGGEGTERRALERLATRLGVAQRTRFIGYLGDEEFPLLHRSVDAYMITSPVELQSISTLEAVASGLPIVAVAARALPELVHHGHNGYLVPPGDWRAAGDALASLLSMKAGAKQMGSNSREVAAAHDVRRSIEAYESLLTATVAARKGENRHFEPLAAAGR